MVLSDGFYYQPIRLDTINTRVYADLLAKEGDANGRGLLVTLTENGLMKDTTGITINLKWEHTSVGNQGLDNFEVVDLSKGLYKITYPTEMLNRGKVRAFIQIIDSGKLAGTRNIEITVDRGVGDDTAIASSDSFTALAQALIDVTNLESTYAPRLLSAEQQLAESVKHTSGYISLKESPFNAVGDGVADDTSAVQSAINYCIANNLALFVPNGTYRLTSVVIASNPIYIFGRGNTGLSSLLGSAQAKFLIDHSGVGIMLAGSYLQFGGGVMEDVAIVCGANYYTDTTMVGLSVYRFNHVSFNRVSFQDFMAGSGVKFISGADFAGQYSSFTDCKFGMCLIGAFIKAGNGVQFFNCMFDGNNNGSWIDNYTTGVPDNSFGVYAIGGDSHKVSGCRFQGFATGVYLNINSGTVHDTRFEMCAIGSHFGPTSQKCTLGTGCKNNNYLLLGKNGLQPTDRFGMAVKNEGATNTIMPFEFGSCRAIADTGENTLRNDVQHVRIFIPEISATKTVPFAIDAYFKYKAYMLKKAKVSASNFGTIDTSYSNRWNIAISGKYVETNGQTLANNTFFDIGDSPNARSNFIDTITFTKNDAATTLTDVVIDMIVECY